MRMVFAFDVVETAPREEPDLFDDDLVAEVRTMLAEAFAFAEELLGQGVSGMSLTDMRSHLEHVTDRRLAQLGIPALYGSPNPFDFLELQDVQELSNFFERKVSAYQVTVTVTVTFDEVLVAAIRCGTVLVIRAAPDRRFRASVPAMNTSNQDRPADQERRGRAQAHMLCRAFRSA